MAIIPFHIVDAFAAELQDAGVKAEDIVVWDRFESHMRQHTIQVEKTLHQLGLVPSESHRLLRLIYAALAEAEGMLIGAGNTYAGMLSETAEEIDPRTEEIKSVLAS